MCLRLSALVALFGACVLMLTLDPMYAAAEILPSTPQNMVNRAWGDDDTKFTKAPFQAGDYVIAQACYTYGHKSAKVIIEGGGIPVGYMSVGTLEANDPERMKFYESIGVAESLRKSVLADISIMKEPYYNPARLAEVGRSYQTILDTVRGMGYRAVEFDNSDFWHVNQEKPNDKQKAINAYVVGLYDYALQIGLKVFQKNTASLAPVLSVHAACAGLITESVGDTTSDMTCTYFQNVYGKYYGRGRALPWYDFSYYTGKKCTKINATAVLAQANGVWKKV